MATIATGRFAGAKLLGGYARHAGRVVVEFNEMTLHHQSYSIQAVAITTDTARTALSTYTNYHVLYRYGWLIGAGLLQGVTNALEDANTTSYLSGNGVGVVTHELSDGEIAASAVGNVGEVLAPIMEKRFDTPPTVHVRAGTGVGILFMKPVEQGLAKG
jgi:Bacterial conjugation TrbI-like protein.